MRCTFQVRCTGNALSSLMCQYTLFLRHDSASSYSFSYSTKILENENENENEYEYEQVNVTFLLPNFCYCDEI